MPRQERTREKRDKRVAPWRPFSEMARWEQQMERLFGDFFWHRLRPFRDERPWSTGGLEMAAPPVDLYEEKDEIVAKIELPGMGKEDIQVDISDRLLTVRGEKKRKEAAKDEDYFRSERSFGSFSRSVEIPVEVHVDRARASFKDGVLEIRVPRSEAAKKREIKIRVA